MQDGRITVNPNLSPCRRRVAELADWRGEMDRLDAETDAENDCHADDPDEVDQPHYYDLDQSYNSDFDENEELREIDNYIDDNDDYDFYNQDRIVDSDIDRWGEEVN